MNIFRSLLLLLSVVVSSSVSAQLVVPQELKGLFNTEHTRSRKSCLPETEWKELGMDTVIARLDHTVTALGNWGLYALLQPTNDGATIKAQQNRLKALTADSQLSEKIKELLTIMAECQHDMFSYLSSTNVPEGDRKLYFSLFPTFLNENKWALDCSFIADCGRSLIGLASLLVFRGVTESIESGMYEIRPKEYDFSERLSHFIGQNQKNQSMKLSDLDVFVNQEAQQFTSALEKETTKFATMRSAVDSVRNLCADQKRAGAQQVTINELAQYASVRQPSEESLTTVVAKGIVKGFLSPLRDHDPRTSLFNDQRVEQLYKESMAQGFISQLRCSSKVSLSDTTLGDKYHFWNTLMGFSKPTAAFLSCGTAIVHDVAFFLQAKGYYQGLKEELKKTSSITQKVRSCARFIQSARELALLLNNHPDFESWNMTSELMELCIPQKLSIELHRLLNLLETCRAQPEHIYSPGSMLLAHRWLHAHAQEFESIFAALAHVDALASIGRMLQESDETAPWCFATCVPSSSAYIKADDFWCLLLKDKPVLNNVACTDGVTKLVITGPNGGGKSTIMKSIAFNVICAQSLGIACARTWEQSIFDRIKTSLDPHEDISRGLSSYMAQKQRMNQLQEDLLLNESLQLVLIDEPYRGTVQRTSEELLYDFCTSIAKAPAVVLLATHFERPTIVAQELPESFANYQCLFAQNADKGLVRTYQFVPGIASWWFHDEHMRSLYLQSLEKEITSE